VGRTRAFATFFAAWFSFSLCYRPSKTISSVFFFVWSRFAGSASCCSPRKKQLARLCSTMTTILRYKGVFPTTVCVLLAKASFGRRVVSSERHSKRRNGYYSNSQHYCDVAHLFVTSFTCIFCVFIISQSHADPSAMLQALMQRNSTQSSSSKGGSSTFSPYQQAQYPRY